MMVMLREEVGALLEKYSVPGVVVRFQTAYDAWALTVDGSEIARLHDECKRLTKACEAQHKAKTASKIEAEKMFCALQKANAENAKLREALTAIRATSGSHFIDDIADSALCHDSR